MNVSVNHFYKSPDSVSQWFGKTDRLTDPAQTAQPIEIREPLINAEKEEQEMDSVCHLSVGDIQHLPDTTNWFAVVQNKKERASIIHSVSPSPSQSV